MDFFNYEDFEFFSKYRKKSYNKFDIDHVKAGERLLKQSVYAKTNYWGSMFNPEIFDFEPYNRWQNSGTFNNYTWAKVFFKGVSNRKVFFTVGVGSRLTQHKDIVDTLEYKIDCQRSNSEPMDPSMVKVFDDYVRENCPEAAFVKIDAHEVENMDWNSLVARTTAFMLEYRQYYLNLTELTELTEENLARKVVRLCWNDNRWEYPSGPAGKSLATGETFEKDKGYGYEEWLFNEKYEIDEYRYGFIQAFNKGDHKGRSYEAFAYAIKNNGQMKEYYWVGKFSNLEILDTHQQEFYLSEFKSRGWLNEMLLDLNAINIEKFDFVPIGDNKIINVRYKVKENNWVRFEKPILIPNPKVEIGKNMHYVALPKVNYTVIDNLPIGQFLFKQGHQTTKIGSVGGKRKTLNYAMELRHKKVQECMFWQLSERFEGNSKEIGTENRTGFGTSIDLVVSCEIDGFTFYEIKTSGSALQCIREAIGQLYEYSYYTNNHYANRLIVVGLSPADKSVVSYLEHLRRISKVQLFYQYFDYEKLLLSDEVH